MIYITLHRKIKIEQHDPTKIRGWTQICRLQLCFIGYKDNIAKPHDHVILVYTVELGTKLESTKWVYRKYIIQSKAQMLVTVFRRRKGN